MRQVPLECDIDIAVNGCSWFATSTQKGPFTAMMISRSRGAYLIGKGFHIVRPQKRDACGQTQMRLGFCFLPAAQVYKLLFPV